MGKRSVSILAFGAAGLLLMSACGAETRQPTEPEPAPQVVETEAVQPEPEQVEDTAPVEDSEPAAEVEPVSEPEPETVPQERYTFDDCNDTIYATSTVNLRSGPGTEHEKVGSLKAGESAVRTGTGTGDDADWSRLQLADGTEVYVNNGYISTTKPAVKQAPKPSGGQSSAPAPSTPSDNDGGEPGGKEFIDSLGQDDLGLLPEGTGGGHHNPNA